MDVIRVAMLGAGEQGQSRYNAGFKLKTAVTDRESGCPFLVLDIAIACIAAPPPRALPVKCPDDHSRVLPRHLSRGFPVPLPSSPDILVTPSGYWQNSLRDDYG
ncbi:hypothetical protein E4Q23_01325 [Candidatus Accumulibacter phosphatis]|jgi:hypothetical protein|uniref:Uncharacterized protein n=1 Tax=Candidatus Accumulibacter phosphatis TaxID=327160 RepID=A0ABX1TQL2_9PROT|nr:MULTISPECIES: hypothetical protein [Candidatus Accumulibacter]NMQ26517.1 hypothetical protein [Candidatus Accumulibacter phosphatis]